MDLIPKAYAISINPTNFSPAGNFPDIGTLINVLVRNILVIAGIAFLLMFIVAGFRFIQKAGKLEPAEFQKIKDTMAAAVVGLLLIVAAYWLVRIIEIITGVKILSPNL